MTKKEKEHWAIKALNQSCFETGKVISRGRRWFSGLDWKDAKKTTAGTLDVLSEKAENMVESVKKSIIDIGGSFKSGFTTSSDAPVKPEVLKGKKSVRKGKATRTTAGTSKAKLKEDLPEKTEKNQRDDEDEPLSASSHQEVLDKTAEEDTGALSAENEDLEKEIERVTEHVPDIGDVIKNTL